MNLTTEHHGDVAVVRVDESRMLYPILPDFATTVNGLVQQGQRKLVQRQPQQCALIFTLDPRQGPRLVTRGGAHVARVHVARDRLAFLAHAPVVIDAQVPADADEPRLEIGPAIEGVQRLEDLDEDVLRQVLGLVVFAGELVRDVEHLPPVLPDDLPPGVLVAGQAALDQRIHLRRGLSGVEWHVAGVGRMITGESASSV